MLTFRCAGCEKTAEYDNGGPKGNTAYNVGDARDKIGWNYSSCGYTQKCVWLCPDCFKKAVALAAQLLEIVKTPYYYLPALLSKDKREEWHDKNR